MGVLRGDFFPPLEPLEDLPMSKTTIKNISQINTYIGGKLK